MARHRNPDYGTDYLIFNRGASVESVTGAMSVAAILKLDSDSNYGEILSIFDGSSSPRIWLEHGASSAPYLTFGSYDGSYNESSSNDGSIGPRTADGWILTAASKAAGTVTARLLKTILGNAADTFATGSGNMKNTTTGTAGGKVYMGQWGASDGPADATFHCMAVWNRELSDAEMSRLAYDMRSWYDSAPVGLWIFDQDATAQHPIDATGLGSTWSAQLGTAVRDGPTNFTYGHDPLIVLADAASGGGSALTASFSDTITLSDVAAKAMGLVKSDTETLSDVAAKVYGKAMADSLTLSDAAGKGVGKPQADTTTLSDSPSKGVGKPAADSTTLSDASIKGVGKAPADTASLSDSPAKSVGKPQADTATLTDAPSKGVGKPAADSTTLSDAAAKGVGKNPADSETLSDASTKAVGKTAADTANLQDGVSSPSFDAGTSTERMKRGAGT